MVVWKLGAIHYAGNKLGNVAFLPLPSIRTRISGATRHGLRHDPEDNIRGHEQARRLGEHHRIIGSLARQRHIGSKNAVGARRVPHCLPGLAVLRVTFPNLTLAAASKALFAEPGS